MGVSRTILRSERPWAPTGIAVHGQDVYVLEYTNANGPRTEGWYPRVRRISKRGKLQTLVTVNPPASSVRTEISKHGSIRARSSARTTADRQHGETFAKNSAVALLCFNLPRHLAVPARISDKSPNHSLRVFERLEGRIRELRVDNRLHGTFIVSGQQWPRLPYGRLPSLNRVAGSFPLEE